MADFKNTKYFTDKENWGDASLISQKLIDELDAFRGAIGTPIYISCGTQGKHVPNSYHYKGLAVDLLFPEMPISKIPDLALIALKFDFRGVGLYNGWLYKGVLSGGLHLDVRETPTRHTWIGLPSGEYLALSFFAAYKLFHGS